jgi:glucose-6-phosphate isomerase
MAAAAATDRSKRTEPLSKRTAWKALQAHYKRVRELHLRKLFADDPKRGEPLTAEAAGLFLDYSINIGIGGSDLGPVLKESR